MEANEAWKHTVTQAILVPPLLLTSPHRAFLLQVLTFIGAQHEAQTLLRLVNLSFS